MIPAPNLKTVDQILDSARMLLGELTAVQPASLMTRGECPAVGGIYLIYEGEKLICGQGQESGPADIHRPSLWRNGRHNERVSAKPESSQPNRPRA